MAAIGWLQPGDVGVPRGAFEDRLLGEKVSMLHVHFFRLDLEIVGAASVLESVHGTVIGGVLGCPFKVDAVCALPTLGDMK